MLDEVRSLLILQDRDRRLLSIAKDLEKLPNDEARAKTKLAGDEAAVTKAHDALRESELKVKKVEMDAETRRTTIKRLRQQQFETRKNDEYQALNHEIARYEKDVDSLETQELEAMEETDKFRSALSTAEAARAQTRKLVEEDLVAIDVRRKKLLETQKEVEAEREPIAATIDGTLLSIYNRLMKSKDGLAVSPMTEGRCGGCHMKLIASSVIKVQTGRELAQCENCSRILYWDD
ncbi:hypothetical protein JIN85_00415 [Luteolibacter pohnpeiensis]|uniref:C4-type zinc ribbon domain-containing protein n=1 Tax=Luteolibacter pohnpeiensis TaxID=454153 RepID=A0A934VSW4_9BACT|nr:C4-type zinc ribbon domain-containing protein [Luteolibacter pohnpeiensis]MBK1880852.1 hypothetical protein [Luteolibacter pohnpeiensis]